MECPRLGLRNFPTRVEWKKTLGGSGDEVFVIGVVSFGRVRASPPSPNRPEETGPGPVELEVGHLHSPTGRRT